MRPLPHPDSDCNFAAKTKLTPQRVIATLIGFALLAGSPAATAGSYDGAAAKKGQSSRSYVNDKRPTRKPPAAQAAIAPSSGGEVLQLGLFAARGDAEWAWLTLNRKNPALADKLSAMIVIGPNGSGHALRAVIKDQSNSGAALCREAQSANQTCFVVAGAQPTDTTVADTNTYTPPPVPKVKPPYPGSTAHADAAAVSPAVSVTAAPFQPAKAPAAVTQSATPVSTVVTVDSPPLPAPVAPLLAAPPQKAVPQQPGGLDGGMLAARTLDGFIRYSTDDAKVLAEIERRTRRRGRIGAVLPGGGLEVTPAILTQPEFNICALTFDDGPHRTVTRRILEILNEEKVVATYFPVGNVATRFPDVIRDFVASGHEIGNHSYTHGDMRQMKLETLRHEVAETNRILRELGGASTLFRPPYGRYSQDLLQVVREEGSQAVLWNVDTRDWKVRDPDKIVEHVVTVAGSGSVLLLHSTYPTTAEALPRVIASLREKKCEFVTLSDWIARMQAAGELPVTNAALPSPAHGARLRN